MTAYVRNTLKFHTFVIFGHHYFLLVGKLTLDILLLICYKETKRPTGFLSADLTVYRTHLVALLHEKKLHFQNTHIMLPCNTGCFVEGGWGVCKATVLW